MQEFVKKPTLRELFNLRDVYAKGRSCMLLSAALVSMITWLSTGLFYTSFLSANGINIVEVGILSFIPLIANCCSIFTPSILERFKKRRWILTFSRVIYYTLNLLGITVMPRFVHDPTIRMYAFIGIVLTANIINSLFTGGYAVWHVNFIPVSVRAEYFSYSTLITNFLGIGTSLLASVIADSLSGSPYEQTIIILLRLIAYVLAIIDVIILALPKEFPYQHDSGRPKFSDIIVKPFKHKRFALTMLIVACYTFFMNITPASLNYYLLNEVGVEYTVISVINFFYPVFLALFLPFWKKRIYKLGWLKTFALGEVLHIPTTLLYSCVTSANYLWILPVVRLTQHFIGVGRNVAYANMLYINLPKKDQTNYVSFHTLILNISAFLGSSLGTGFVAALGDYRLRVSDLDFCNVQILMWFEALGQFITPLLVVLLLKKLTPPEETD